MLTGGDARSTDSFTLATRLFSLEAQLVGNRKSDEQLRCHLPKLRKKEKKYIYIYIYIYIQDIKKLD